MSQASTAPRPPRCATPARASRSRTAASTRTSSASATSAAGSARAVAPPAGSARRDRRHRGDERLDRGLVDALRDRPPAGARRGTHRVQGRQHVAAAGEVVRERDDGPQMRDGRAVAQLLRRVVELRRVHGDGRHRPRPELGQPARRGPGCGADELGGRQRAAGVGREQERDLGGRAGVQRRQRGGGHGERVRPRGAQGPAAPGGGPLPVFGPQQHPPPRRPQGVHHEHPATLRPLPRTPAGAGGARRVVRESAPLPPRVGTFACASRPLRQCGQVGSQPDARAQVDGYEVEVLGGGARCTRGRTGSRAGPRGHGCAQRRVRRGSGSTRAPGPRRRRRSRCGRTRSARGRSCGTA